MSRRNRSLIPFASQSPKRKGYQSSNAYRAGRHAPTVLQAGAVAIPSYFLTQVLVEKADRFAKDQYFEGSAYLNNGEYPAILAGMATGFFMLQVVAIVSPLLFDWLLADGSRLRQFLSWSSERLSSLGRRSADQYDDFVEYHTDDGAEEPLINNYRAVTAALEFDDNVAATHPYWRNAYNIFLRGVTALGLHTASFAMVAVLPAGDAALRFALAEYWDYTDQEVEAACQTLANVGISTIPLIQLFTMLAANVILNYRDTPGPSPKTARHTLNVIQSPFAHMGVVRSAAAYQGSELESESTRRQAAAYQGSELDSTRRQLLERIQGMGAGSIQRLTEMRVLERSLSSQQEQAQQNYGTASASSCYLEGSFDSLGGGSSRKVTVVSGSEQEQAKAKASAGVDKRGSPTGQFSVAVTEAEGASGLFDNRSALLGRRSFQPTLDSNTAGLAVNFPASTA